MRCKSLAGLAIATGLIGVASPASATTTISATAGPEANFAVSADGSTVAYEGGNFGLYVWSHGATRKITGARLSGYSLSANGDVLGFTGGSERQTTFVNLASRHRSTVKGFMLSDFYPHVTPMLDASGRYALLDKTAPPGKPAYMTTAAVYDRIRHAFVVLPHLSGLTAEPRAISADGTVILYGEAKPYHGEVNTVFFNRLTHSIRRVKGSSGQIAWLSSDGSTAILEHFTGSGEPFVYDYKSGTGTLPLGHETKPNIWELGPWAGNSTLFTSVTLTGDGTRIFFTCGESAYSYDIPSQTFYLVAADPFGEGNLPNVELNAAVSEDDSKVVMASTAFGGARGKPGIIEIETGQATLIDPKIAPDPSSCQPLVR